MLSHGDLTKTGSICRYHETTKTKSENKTWNELWHWVIYSHHEMSYTSYKAVFTYMRCGYVGVTDGHSEHQIAWGMNNIEIHTKLVSKYNSTLPSYTLI